MLEVNLNIYCTVILAISMFASGAIGARIAYFLAKRWSCHDPEVKSMMTAAALCAAGASYHISIGLALASTWYAFAGILLCPLVTALSWLYLVGGIRLSERILTELDSKLTEK